MHKDVVLAERHNATFSPTATQLTPHVLEELAACGSEVRDVWKSRRTMQLHTDNGEKAPDNKVPRCTARLGVSVSGWRRAGG